MNISAVEVIVMIILFFIFAIGPTLFTARFYWLLYKIVEFMCILSGEECKEALRNKYDPLGTDPAAYARSHPTQIFLGKVLGGIIFLLFIVFFIVINE